MESAATKKLDQIERQRKLKIVFGVLFLSLLFVVAVLYIVPVSNQVKSGSILSIMPVYSKSNRQGAMCKVKLSSGSVLHAKCNLALHKVGDQVQVSIQKSHLFGTPRNVVLNYGK